MSGDSPGLFPSATSTANILPAPDDRKVRKVGAVVIDRTESKYSRQGERKMAYLGTSSVPTLYSVGDIRMNYPYGVFVE
jgi:hypothetical protein